MDWARKWLVDFKAGKTQLVLYDRSKNTGAIDVKMDGSVLEENHPFKTLGLTFSYKLDWRSDIISVAKTATKKIGALIRSMKFLLNYKNGCAERLVLHLLPLLNHWLILEI